LSLLKHFLGLESGAERSATAGTHSRSVADIAAHLERLPPERARFVAAFAFVLARIARADLEVSDEERQKMRRTIEHLSGLDPEEARIATELACDRSEELGASDHYIATREFRAISTREQRAQLLECLFEVAAADGNISAEESYEVLEVAEELGFARAEALGMRARYRDKLSELRDDAERTWRNDA